MLRTTPVLAAIGTAMLAACGGASNDTGPDGQVTIHVVGSAANSNIYSLIEEPFWTADLPAATAGRIRADLRSITESGLKGGEIARLLAAGALDVAYSDFGAVAGDQREFEGLDLAAVIPDFDTMHAAAEAYKPVIEHIFDGLGIRLLGIFPYPQYAFYCTGQVGSLADLKGKKIRISRHSMADFLAEIGAVPVNIPYADVVPALQTGVADCAVTGTYSGNRAGWYEFTDSLFTLPIGGGAAFYGYSQRGWDALDPEVQAMFSREFARFEEAAWELTKKQTRMGINCNTGTGDCELGTVAGMTLHEPSADDVARARQIAVDIVLPKWAERCGRECVEGWNGTIGEVAGVQAPLP